MTMRPPRFGLALGTGALTGLLVFAFGLAPLISRPARSKELAPAPRALALIAPPAAPVAPAAPGEAGGISFPSPTPAPLTPFVPFGDGTGSARGADTGEIWIVRFLRAPWAPVLCGFLVFLICSRLFRNRIVLDRARNEVRRRGKVVGELSRVAELEVEDYANIQRMNGMDLVFKDGRRETILLYDGRADAGLRQAAADIAGFAGVPVAIKEGGTLAPKAGAGDGKGDGRGA